MLADKAFDGNGIVAHLKERGAKVVISKHPRRSRPILLDTEMYKSRPLIEYFFCKLKEFKPIAVPACNAGQSVEAMIYLGVAVINSQ